jgi:hypothetical protein
MSTPETFASRLPKRDYSSYRPADIIGAGVTGLRQSELQCVKFHCSSTSVSHAPTHTLTSATMLATVVLPLQIIRSV